MSSPDEDFVLPILPVDEPATAEPMLPVAPPAEAPIAVAPVAPVAADPQFTPTAPRAVSDAGIVDVSREVGLGDEPEIPLG